MWIEMILSKAKRLNSKKQRATAWSCYLILLSYKSKNTKLKGSFLKELERITKINSLLNMYASQGTYVPSAHLEGGVPAATVYAKNHGMQRKLKHISI